LNSSGKQVKSKQRVADHGEVFTAKREVNAMLDMVKEETERIESTFLEPACGDGNFLIEILARKLKVVAGRYADNQLDYELHATIAISSIYGVDILEDNVRECRHRLNSFFLEQYKKLFPNTCKEECKKSVEYLLGKNIIWGDALDYKLVEDKNVFITFCEWTAVDEMMIKRKDFTMQSLLTNDVFAEIADSYDIDDFLPPDKEYPAIHFLRLYELGE
jgi:hypothetical protein